MPLLRHAATHAPLASSTIQQHSLPYQQQCSHLYYLLTYRNPQWPYYPRSPQQKWHQQQQRQQQSRTRKHAFHTTSRLQDKQIDNAQNHYEALKLEPGATPAEVKKYVLCFVCPLEPAILPFLVLVQHPPTYTPCS